MNTLTRHHINMRRFIIAFLLATAAATFFISQDKDRELPLPDKLEHAMNSTRMNTYRDKFYGYTIQYPSFFEQIPDSLINERGCCKFRFWYKEQITQTAFVALRSDGLTMRQEMSRVAAELHATDRQYGADYFILSGPLYIGDEKIDGYRFHTKYVLRQKLWFVQFLAYPKDYSQAVTRLIESINDWQVWQPSDAAGDRHT